MMKSKFYSVVVLLILSMIVCELPSFGQGLPTVQPEKVGLSSERLMRIDDYVDSVIEEGRISGAVVLVARKGKVAYFKTFGWMDIESKKRMEKDALFRIGSMTKPVTCTAAMTLYEKGRFLLNDPVWMYIPEFKDPKVLVIEENDDRTSDGYETIPAERQILIRHLLNHTSGISYGNGPHAKIYEEAGLRLGRPRRSFESTSELVQVLATLPLLHEPGKKFTYGYSQDVIGYLIEVLSKEPMNLFYREHVFNPLGMKDTRFIIPEEKSDRLVISYRPLQGGKLERVQISQNQSGSRPQRIFSAGGGLYGLYSTASDFARFCQMILNGGELDGVRILSPKTIELMTTNSLGDVYAAFRPTSGDKYGYGFGIRTERGQYNELESMGILGWDGGSKTRFWIDPEEELIGIFMTQLRGGTWRIHQVFRNLVYQAIID